MAPFPSPASKRNDNTYQSKSSTRPELSAKGKSVERASRITLLGRRKQPLFDTKPLEHKFAGVEVFAASADVMKKSKVDEAFAKFVGDGKIDVLVSNMVMIGPQDPVEYVDADKFVEATQQNLRGSLLVVQAFLRYAATDAAAIDINSIAKLEIFRLCDSVAFANPELLVFHVQLGVVDTNMNKEASDIAALGFSDDVSLLADFNVWLASPEARFLKGKHLWTNWDVDELQAEAKGSEASTYLSIKLVGWPFQPENGTWKLEPLSTSGDA
ncbi:hypothetical protein DV736_g862, partial [Chaetothyriales sp. CBS 134916]